MTSERSNMSGNKVIAIVTVMLSAMALSWGVGARLIGDRIAVQTTMIQTRADVRQIREGMAQMQDAISKLAHNEASIRVLSERVDQHDRRLEKLEAEQ